MNIKKSFLVALAAVTAVTSVSAMTVSASTLGDSTEAISIIADGVNETEAIATLDGGNKTVYAKVNLANDLAAGNYTLVVSVVADKATEEAFDAVVSSEFKDVFEISLKDANGNTVDFNNIKVTFAKSLNGLDVKSTATGANDSLIATTADVFYNEAYGVDGVTFADLNAEVSNAALSFSTNGYSKFVLAYVNNETSESQVSTEEPISKPESQSQTDVSKPTPSTPTTPTGDNTAATAAVFAVMGVVALGTVLATTKMKKSSK